jgi:hypothetical protein
MMRRAGLQVKSLPVMYAIGAVLAAIYDEGNTARPNQDISLVS